jgi:hypothetical protein
MNQLLSGHGPTEAQKRTRRSFASWHKELDSTRAKDKEDVPRPPHITIKHLSEKLPRKPVE